MLSTIMSAPIAHAFSPADWLRKFEALGGGYVVSDTRTSFCIPLQGVTLAEQHAANALLQHLTEGERASVVQHIRDLAGLPRLRWNRPVGKHVDIQRQREWGEALAAYRKVDRLGPDDDQTPAIDALNRLATTPAPSLRALHEKLTIVTSNEYLNSDEAVAGLFADVEYLARRYEIASDDMQAATDTVADAADSDILVEA